MAEKINQTKSTPPLPKADPPADPAPRSLEEQKTRLWAMSFESTKQIIHCEKCGAANIVNRLGEATTAVPTLRVNEAPMPAHKQKERLDCADQTIAENKKLSREKKAIIGLTALSTGLAVALAASLINQRRN